MSVSPATVSELAPTGKLRIGLNYANFLLVLKDAPDRTPQGIAPDIGRELANRLGVKPEYVRFDGAGKLADGVKSGMWDVAFLGNEPQRASEIAFTPAYLEIPVTTSCRPARRSRASPTSTSGACASRSPTRAPTTFS